MDHTRVVQYAQKSFPIRCSTRIAIRNTQYARILAQNTFWKFGSKFVKMFHKCVKIPVTGVKNHDSGVKLGVLACAEHSGGVKQEKILHLPHVKHVSVTN
jgi:hypothetical protein